MTPNIIKQTSLVVIGALHVDDVATPLAELYPAASNPVQWHQSIGGVAANAARVASQFVQTTIIAAVGDDPLGQQLREQLQAEKLDVSLLTLHGRATGRYTVILDASGELFVGLSDVAQAETLSWAHIEQRLPRNIPGGVLLDANLNERCLCDSVQNLEYRGSPAIIAMAVSPAKASRWLPIAHQIDLLFCNRAEAAALTTLPRDSPINQLADALTQLGFRRFVLTDGPQPLLVHTASQHQHIKVPENVATHSVNGAGDALAGATTAHWIAGQNLSRSIVEYGLPAARAVLRRELLAEIW